MKAHQLALVVNYELAKEHPMRLAAPPSPMTMSCLEILSEQPNMQGCYSRLHEQMTSTLRHASGRACFVGCLVLYSEMDSPVT